jgi:hypothetical protein
MFLAPHDHKSYGSNADEITKKNISKKTPKKNVRFNMHV